MLFFILISYFCIKCLILQFHLDKGIIAFNRGDPAEGEQFCRKKKSRRRQRPHPTPATINSANKTLLTINPRPNVLPSSDCSQFYFLLRTKTPPPARASPPIFELLFPFPASCNWQLTVFLSSSLILYFARWEFINWDCFVVRPIRKACRCRVSRISLQRSQRTSSFLFQLLISSQDWWPTSQLTEQRPWLGKLGQVGSPDLE